MSKILLSLYKNLPSKKNSFIALSKKKKKMYLYIGVMNDSLRPISNLKNNGLFITQYVFETSNITPFFKNFILFIYFF